MEKDLMKFKSEWVRTPKGDFLSLTISEGEMRDRGFRPRYCFGGYVIVSDGRYSFAVRPMESKKIFDTRNRVRYN